VAIRTPRPVRAAPRWPTDADDEAMGDADYQMRGDKIKIVTFHHRWPPPIYGLSLSMAESCRCRFVSDASDPRPGRNSRQANVPLPLESVAELPSRLSAQRDSPRLGLVDISRAPQSCWASESIRDGLPGTARAAGGAALAGGRWCSKGSPAGQDRGTRQRIVAGSGDESEYGRPDAGRRDAPRVDSRALVRAGLVWFSPPTAAGRSARSRSDTTS
jgi:hypothetical protein